MAKLIHAALPVLAGLAFPAFAHVIPTREAPMTVDASAVMTWRSASLIGDYEFWQVPGTLMGGHAWPARKGLELDEWNLGLAYRFDQNLFAVTKLGAHAGGTDEHGGVELEHAYVGWVCCDQTGPWVAELGRMSARFSPSVGAHASERLFSEAPLAVDVFFGRYFHDQGLRLWWHETAGITLGAELWRGEAFPATASENGGAWDLFARYAWQGGPWTVEAGGWFYHAAAESRADHRYGGGHQHVPVAPPGQTAALFPDTRYTGDTDIAGVHGRLARRLNRDWRWALEFEWMQATLEGVVHDGIGRQADLQATQSGAWVQPSLSWRQHTLALRWEQLTTDNDLSGAAAPQLAVDSGLANPGGHNPARLAAVWFWQWRPGLAVRAELTRDDTLADTEQRVALGVVWKQRLWPRGDTALHGH